MSTTDQTRTTGRSGSRLALIVVGVVVLLALAVWAFSSLGGDSGTPAGTTSTSASPSQPAPTTAGTGGATQPGNAAIQLTAAVGADSRNVRVQGAGFAANEEVVLSVDGTEAKRVKADTSGAFLAGINVSYSKTTFTVRADGVTSRKSATGTVSF